jgi:hypothetical protein
MVPPSIVEAFICLISNTDMLLIDPVATVNTLLPLSAIVAPDARQATGSE